MVYFIRKWYYQDHDEPKNVSEAWKNIIKEYMERLFGSNESIILALINIMDEAFFDPKATKRLEDLVLNIFDNQ